MKFIELQEAFELEINRIDNNLEKPKSTDIEYWLNRGLEKFYKTRYSGINYKSLGFEQNQKRIDDLRTLIDYQYYTLDEESWLILKENNEEFRLHHNGRLVQEDIPNDKIQTLSGSTFYLKLPTNYMFLLGDTVGVVPINDSDIRCAKKDANGELIPEYSDTLEATIETLDSIRKNTLSEHRFKYLKARPIRLIENNNIVLITDGNYKISNYRLTFVRKPNEINIHAFPYDEYTDMPKHTHSEIVKLAVSMYLENQRSDRYNTYSNEINLME